MTSSNVFKEVLECPNCHSDKIQNTMWGYLCKDCGWEWGHD